MRFAIVTPTLNHARYLPDAIASVRMQHGVAVDYLVRDGGSTDGTRQILRDLGVRYVSQPDDGQADAINKGFRQTRGEILGWLNADDRYTPGALPAVARVFEDNPSAGLVYGQARFISAVGRRIAPCVQVEDFSLRRLREVSDYITQPAAFFRRSAFEAVGGLDASLHWTMDYDLWLKLAHRFKVIRLNRVLAEYRWAGDNKTATNPAGRLLEVERVVRRHGGDRLPVYFAIESAALAAGQGDVVSGLRQLANGRVLGELLSPRTWRIIYTRTRLRSSSADRCST